MSIGDTPGVPQVAAAAGATVGYVKWGIVGGLFGGVVGYFVVPEMLDQAELLLNLLPWRSLTKEEHKTDIYAGLNIGAAVKQPSTADAVKLLRPAVAMFKAWGPGGSRIATAALVNAWAESRFDPLAAGDLDSTGRPMAIGIYQLHENGGGKGMSVAERVNVVAATSRAIELAKAAGWDGTGGDMKTGELVALFTYDVEKPADVDKKAAERREALNTNTYLRSVLTGLGLPLV